MNRFAAIAKSLLVLTAFLLEACADHGPSTGTDEHTNSVSLRILVRDTSGRPAIGSKVSVRGSKWLDTPSIPGTDRTIGILDTTTDSSGFVRIDLPSDSGYVVRAGNADFAGSTTVMAGIPSRTTLVLQPTGSIQGHLNGAPEGVPVRAPGLPGATRTDAEGRFSLGALPAGTMSLWIGERPNILRIEGISIQPGRALDLGTLPQPRVGSDTSITLAGKESPLPARPDIVPSGGTFQGVQTVSVTLPSNGFVETSTDGMHWLRLSGSLRVASSVCIQARSVSDDGIVSNLSEACFNITP